MTLKLGVIMDPISLIHYHKDSTLAMLWEAQKRHYEIYYLEQKNLYLRDGQAYGLASPLSVYRDAHKWFEIAPLQEMALSQLNIILMRKDPPFDEEFLYTTYILDDAERRGVMVVNKPSGLRDANEKIAATLFPGLTPKTIVTQSVDLLHAFWQELGDIVCKPLNTMGGQSVFHLQKNDPNANVIFDLLTQSNTAFIMGQQFIPEITEGDKRIIFIDGEVVPYMLVRVPQAHDWRGNLAVGAKGIVKPLSNSEKKICAKLGAAFKEKGLYFVGIDMIGDYLTEINVTSPTGIQEIEADSNVNISKQLFDCLEKKINI